MVSIVIPAYGAVDQLRNCLQSLAKYAPVNCHIFVVDDGTPDDSIVQCCHESNLANLTYTRSDVNRGFVVTCNWAWKTLAAPGSDILLLNSDTEVTAGFLDEMLRVLYLFERHAVVTPRSNNATIFSLPFEVWRHIGFELPDYQVMPTAVGFCMLIKASILQQFGLFDEIYSPGYNEENDFVCRINRYGYSAIAANRAFVFHHDNSTFGGRRSQLEAEHHKILVARYPEYERKIADYLAFEIDPVEKFAPLRQAHRPTILYDLSHLPAKHNGSSEFALSLLRELYLQTHDEWDLVIGMTGTAQFFASDLTGYEQMLFPINDRLFDIAFKPAQFFTWTEFRNLQSVSPRLSFVLQDIIAVRSDYLAYAARKTIFAKTIDLADQIITISEFSRADYEAYFGTRLSSTTIHHGTNCGLTPSESMPGEYILVVGNSFAHKGLNEAIPYLTHSGLIRVLGGPMPSSPLPDSVQWLESGQLTRNVVRELYAKAKVLIYPSYYEGFGLPIIEALALGKRVIALDNQLNREIAAAVDNKNLSLVSTIADVLKAINQPDSHPTQHIRRWNAVAAEYVSALRELLQKPPDAVKMRQRSEFFRILNAANHL